jgi:hypothetical protein
MKACHVLASALLSVVPAFGHHFVAEEFDISKTVRMSGTISKVTFSNPHVTFSLEVKNPDGTVTHWNVETASPNVLLHYGITKNLLANGATLAVNAYLAKDGSSRANSRGIILKLDDGRELAVPGQYTCNGPNCIQGTDNSNGFWVRR